MNKEYLKNLDAEVKTWNIEDEEKRHEKIQRERIRHYKLIKDLLLDKLDTERMDVLEIGGGPVPVIDLIPAKTKTVVDPLTHEYDKFFPCPNHVDEYAEEIVYKEEFDLVVCTNALDHVFQPETVVDNINHALRPGGFFAVLCAENNALVHKHPAHKINLTPNDLHGWLDDSFETVWQLDYANNGFRYGWVKHNGKVGQPAFAILFRKVVGYGN